MTERPTVVETTNWSFGEAMRRCWDTGYAAGADGESRGQAMIYDTDRLIAACPHIQVAVNCHADLVAALKMAACALASDTDEWGSVRHKTEVAQARAAIEKAEGK